MLFRPSLAGVLAGPDPTLNPAEDKGKPSQPTFQTGAVIFSSSTESRVCCGYFLSDSVPTYQNYFGAR